MKALIFAIWAIFSGVILVVCDFPATLTLHRAIPLNDRVELSQLRAHDRARHGRLLQSVNGVVNFPVAGTYNPYRVGLYYTKVQLGSPAKEFSVQIDTGSDVLWVGCSGCDGCPTTTGLQLNTFDPSSSSSSSVISCSDKRCSMGAQYSDALCDNSNNCAYQFQYGDGSATQGYYVSDVFHLDTVVGGTQTYNNSAKVLFGCSMTQTGDLTKTDRAVDGIFGLGQQSMSVVTQLSSQGLTPAAFSHCLRGDDNGGGILVFGSIVEPGMVYTPLVPSQPHYNLYLQSISVKGQKLPIDSSVFSTSTNAGTIIDSGTTLAYLAEGAYDPFVNAISSAASQSQSVRPLLSRGNSCYLITSSVSDVFPEVSLNFAGGASMVLKPQDYLLEQNSIAGAAVWCMGFQKIDGQGMTILGDLVLKDKIIVYDLANQRIGWVNYDCSQSVNVSTSTGSNTNTYISTGQLSNSPLRASISYTTMLSGGVIAMFAYLIFS